ncbi:MAG: DNA methyltransferase [Candidatus Omnitrophota bacterium]
MANQQINLKTAEELQQVILQEKKNGTPDVEIGQKYGVTFKYIERLITKSQGLNISAFNISKRIKTLHPKDFKEEQTTVWSFKQRGTWATHSGEYRGNWSPYIPRNAILKYSNPGELVLDYFCGGGTTAVEAKLLGRKCTALDINDKAIELAKKNLDFKVSSSELPLLIKNPNPQIYEPKLLVGDARKLSFLPDDSVDLICAHPPYANILQYTNSKDGDLSFLDIDEFLEEMSKVARESFRVLKPGKQCAILIGDTRRKKNVIPLGFRFISTYLDAGFKLRELVIKRQHNCKTTGFWYNNSIKYNFLLLAHEYLPIFEKPQKIDFEAVKENIAGYHGSLFPEYTRLPLSKKLEKFETTTVWLLPEKTSEKQLNKNLVERYSGGNGYKTVILNNQDANSGGSNYKSNKKRGLLLIKTSVVNVSDSPAFTEMYLQSLNKVIFKEIGEIYDDGYVVLQTYDVRIKGYIKPLAKKIVDVLSRSSLLLKEIIVLTSDNLTSSAAAQSDFLVRNHEYLLVYQVKRGH